MDFVVETSGKGICKMGAVIPFEALFPSSHEVILQSPAQSLLSPLRPPCHLSALSSHSPSGGWGGRESPQLPVMTSCPLLSPQHWLMNLVSLKTPKSKDHSSLISTFPHKVLP